MIGIIGAGTMGKGIAIEFARFGYKVKLVSVGRHLSREDLLHEIKSIVSKYDFLNMEEILTNIEEFNSFDNIGDCELIIEALSENLEIKRATLRELARLVAPNTIFASNTSSLSIRNIFSDIIDLENVLGLHVFNPVQLMKLVEVSFVPETSIRTIDFVVEYLEKIEKIYVKVKDSPGFIVNRLLIPMINEASKMVDEGLATVDDIDKAMKYGANHPMGPLKLSDLIGNDITLAILNVLKDNKTDIKISKELINLVDKGKLGRKTGHGYYLYKTK
jgi:3-hydroxybutyryl-CoA dehydrogenase